MTSKNENTPALEPIPKSIMNVVWILVLGSIMPLLDSTMVNIAINHLSSDFKSGLDLIQWVVTCYVLAMAVCVPLAGWIVQRINGKWLMISANIVFLAGSIAAGFCGSINLLIVFRIIQGCSAVIQLNNLTKTFDGFQAVSNVSFEVNKGEIFGFVGLNGAGKSTTIHMMLSLLRPSSGSV